MKTKNAKLHLALLCSVLIIAFSSCVKNNIDTQENTVVAGIDVPSDFNWSTITSAQLTVTLADKTPSPYYYTVSVYGENPLFNSSAVLLAKGVTKLGVDYTTELVIPTSTEVIYVKQVAPSGMEVLQSVEVKGQSLSCDFNSATASPIKAMPALSSLRSANVAVADPTPAGAVILTSTSKDVSWENNKNYVISEGQTFKGTIQLGQNSNLFIEGTYSLNDKKKTLSMADGGRIVIQSSGKLIVGSDNDLSFHIGQIKNFGTLTSGAKFALTSKSTMYNTGAMNFKILTASNAENQIVNDGEINAENASVQSNPFTNNGSLKSTEVFELATNCHFVNNGTAEFAELNAKSNSAIYNNCHIVVKDLMDIHGIAYLGYPGSLLKAATLQSDGVVYTLSESSIIDAEEALFSTYRNYINGAGTDYALVRFGKVDSYKKAVSKNITYQGKLEVECSDHLSNEKNNPFWLVEGANVRWSAKGASTTVIASTGCNDGGNAGLVVVPEPPTDPNKFPILVKLTTDYTFLMEDNWPLLGDYDLNDLVVGLSISYLQNENNKATEMKVVYTLRAVGASKRIAAAFQLDKITPNQISSVSYQSPVLTGEVFKTEKGGLEVGQSNAVIPLFDDAHLLLNPTSGATASLINSIIAGEYYEPVTDSVRIVFTSPIDPSDISIANLNFFIVTNKPAPGGLRSEVHLSGSSPTDKADPFLFGTAADNSVVGKKYTTSDNMIWGMLIPVNFKYASEWRDITSVYPQFSQWCITGGVENSYWYEYPTDKSGYVFVKEK